MNERQVELNNIESIVIKCIKCSTELKVPFIEIFDVENCPQCKKTIDPSIGFLFQKLKDYISSINESKNFKISLNSKNNTKNEDSYE